MTVEKNLGDFFYLFNLLANLSQLLAGIYYSVSLQKIFCLNSLFLSGTACIDFSHPLSEVGPFISNEDLISEVRPIEFIVGLSVNCNDYPLKDLIGLWFSVLNLNFWEGIGINFGSNLNSFFPFCKIFFFIGFNLFSIFIFFIIIFKLALIKLCLIIQLVDLFFQLRNRIGALWFEGTELLDDGIDSIGETLNFACLRLNHINIFIDKFGCHVTKGSFESDKFLSVLFEICR